jgi:two-component system, OmpR family, heavy metal sensor histidine kinase CusS
MAPFKLRSKLAIWYALLVVVTMGSLSVALFELVELRLTAEADDNLVDHLAGFWGYVHFNNGKPSLVFDPNNEYLKYFLREATRYYQIYDAETGALLLESDDSALMRLALSPEQVGTLVRRPGIDNLAHAPSPLRFRSAVFVANEHPYLVRVGVSVEQDVTNLSELRRVLVWLVPLTAALAAFGSWRLAGRVLRPLRDLEQAASAISITQLRRRLPQRGSNDELDSLAITFNQVLTRLDASVIQMRDFADFMAHELRTPMTILRGEIEVELMRSDLPDEWRSHLESHLEEFGKLHRLIDRFLLVAKAETGGIQLEIRRISLSDLAQGLVELMQPLAESMGVQLSTVNQGDVEGNADKVWMERALSNLMDNALKFTRAGGEIRIAVHDAPSGAVIEIADSGCGIDPIDLPRIFDRFYRAAHTRSSSPGPGGLGLSLAKWVIEQHHGTISVRSVVNEGSTFTIYLPAVQENMT